MHFPSSYAEGVTLLAVNFAGNASFPTSHAPVRTKAKLRQAANDHMAMLVRSPEHVMSYFQEASVRYVACYFIGPEQ